jgi:predicted PurR-regulated permease PerM
MTRKIEISHRTIIFTFFFLVSMWFLYYIRDIVIQLFGAFLLVSILNPLVTKLSKYKIPKGVSIMVAYILIFGIFSLAVAAVLPPLIEQTTNFANNLPGYFSNSGLSSYLNEDIIRQIVSQLGSIPGQVVRAGLSLFGNILSILTVAIFAFYILLIRDRLDQNIEYLFGKDNSKKAVEVIDVLERRLGGWARGQLFLMLLIGVLSYLGFILLGIPYALPLALLAGILEVIPYIGPIVAAIPVIVLAFGLQPFPFLGLAAIGLAILIQQLENYVFVPKIMEKSVGVSPIITLISLAIGFKLAGVVGIVFSIPVVIIIQTLLKNKFEKLV